MNVVLFDSLSPEDRATSMTHPEYGAVTVNWLIDTIAGHELHQPSATWNRSRKAADRSAGGSRKGWRPSCLSRCTAVAALEREAEADLADALFGLAGSRPQTRSAA